MEYYAHKRDSDKEKVETHLEQASQKACEYGNKFGCGSIAGAIARVHDVAKMTERFQNVLFHGECQINHATPAAQILYELTEHSDKAEDCIAYMSTEGHHTALGESYNYLGNSLHRKQLRHPTDFEKLDKNGKRSALSSNSDFERILQYVRDNKLYDHDPIPHINEMDNVELMLLTRMIHSCVVDGDYSSTEEYMNPDLKITEYYAEPDKMIPLINKKKKDLSQLNAGTPMQALRDKVYDVCVQAAEKDVDLYRLSAPTGLGKTLATMAFAASHAAKHGQKRIFVVLPFLTITSQSFTFYREMFESLGVNYVLEDDSNSRNIEIENGIRETNGNTKKYIDQWNAPVIVTTSVKFFETMMASNTPTLRKLHQISNAVVIFDEAQTLPADLLDITLNTLKALPKYYNTTVLFSSATQPEYKYRKEVLADFHEIMNDASGLYQQYEIIKNTHTTYLAEKQPYTQIAERVKAMNNAIIVMNTVAKARAMYRAAKDAAGQEHCILLTSWFSGIHKRRIIAEIKRRIKAGEKCILISTQCIEAGIDLDFTFGMREIAPWTSLVQTAGRINRNGYGKGEYIIFELDSGYPDVMYENLTKVSRYMLMKHKEFSLTDLSLIDEYYKEYFRGIADADNPVIKNAASKLDMHLLSQNYHLIKEAGQDTILVDYGWPEENNQSVFDLFLNKLQQNGFRISKKEMGLYRQYAVSVTAGKKTQDLIRKTCRQLYTYGPDKIPLPWFIDYSKIMYDKDTGLKKEESEVKFNGII